MAGIIPSTLAGAKVVRQQDGTVVDQPTVEYAYVPPAAFTTSCDLTYLPSDCTARLFPSQINAFQSEMMCLAQTLDPTGNWNCDQICNLSAAFIAWVEDSLNYDILGPLPDSVLPARLRAKTIGKTTGSMDDIVESGWINVGGSVANLPSDVTSPGYVFAISRDDNYTKQFFYARDSNRSWSREMVAGVWSAWVETTTSWSVLGTIPDGNLPARLRQSVTSNTSSNLNTATLSGWYHANANATNRPLDVIGYVHVIASTTSYVKQIWYERGGNRVFQRENVNGTWSAWVEMPGARRVFETRADAIASRIPANVTTILVQGYASVTDGGRARFVRSATEPTHEGKLQTLDGGWWVIADGVLNVRQFGAVADATSATAGTNNSPVFTATLAACLALGRNMYVPAGKYRLQTVLTYNKTTLNADNDFVPSIYGDGPTMTRLYCGASGIQMLGSLTAGFYVSWIKISDLGLFGNNRAGYGIWIENQGFVRLERVRCSYFDRGLYMKGVISSKVEQPYFSENNFGMHCLPDDGNLFPPNAITVDQPWIANNREIGIRLDNPATFNIRGGSVEGNGYNQSVSGNSRGGIHVRFAGNGGHASIVSTGVYYEYNSGVADIVFFGSSMETAASFDGNTFTRMGANPTMHCIYVGSMTHKFALNVTGNGFGELGSGATGLGFYINVDQSTFVKLTESGNTYQNDAYIPTYANVMADCEQMRPISCGYVAATGVIVGTPVNVASVEKIAAGRYKITPARSVPGRKFVVATPGIPRVVHTLVFDDASVTVVFTELNGTETDVDFGFHVYANSKR